MISSSRENSKHYYHQYILPLVNYFLHLSSLFPLTFTLLIIVPHLTAGSHFGFYFVLFLRQGLTLLPRVDCSAVILAHGSLDLLGSSDSPATASKVAGTTGVYYHAWLIFSF